MKLLQLLLKALHYFTEKERVSSLSCVLSVWL